MKTALQTPLCLVLAVFRKVETISVPLVVCGCPATTLAIHVIKERIDGYAVLEITLRSQVSCRLLFATPLFPIRLDIPDRLFCNRTSHNLIPGQLLAVGTTRIEEEEVISWTRPFYSRGWKWALRSNPELFPSPWFLLNHTKQVRASFAL